MQKQCLPSTRVVLSIALGWLLVVPATGGLSQAKKTVFCVAPQTPQDLQELFRFTGHSLPLVSAHRGGAGEGLPENCIATFEATLATTYSMLEIDPRVTRDGHVVIVHDATLQRTTTGHGAIAFVGHKPPSDKGLLQMIHDKGAMCMAGTSRHLDLRLAALPAADTATMNPEYRNMLEFGVDILETDVPREVGPLLYHSGNHQPNVPSEKSKFFATSG